MKSYFYSTATSIGEWQSFGLVGHLQGYVAEEVYWNQFNIKRLINGVARRYCRQMSSRPIKEVKDDGKLALKG